MESIKGYIYGSLQPLRHMTGNPDFWNAEASLQIDERQLLIWYQYRDMGQLDYYKIQGYLSKQDYYDCKIICGEEILGDCFLWVYQNIKGYMISGDYREDGKTWNIIADFSKQ